MSTQTFNKIAIVWLALWFGVVVPGHKRGLVLLPGGEKVPTRLQSDKPCPLAKLTGKTGSCCPSSKAPSDQAPAAPGSHCAVCYLTGVLDVPAPPDLTAPPLELLDILPWPDAVQAKTIQIQLAYFGRAPPLS